MNRGEMRNRCRSRFRDVSQAVYDDSEWNTYLDEALADVVNASPWWPWAERTLPFTVTAGTASVELGVQVPGESGVNYVYNETDQWPLLPYEGPRGRPWRDWPDVTTSQGPPIRYSLEGTQLRFWPRPASTTVIRVGYFDTAEVTMAADTATPPIPDRYHTMLIDGALTRAYQDDGNMEQAGGHQARFDKALANLLHELSTARSERYPALTDNWWG